MNDNGVKKAAQKLAARMIRREKFGWPPDCYGPLYQPQRPRVLPQQDAQTPEASAQSKP